MHLKSCFKIHFQTNSKFLLVHVYFILHSVKTYIEKLLSLFGTQLFHACTCCIGYHMHFLWFFYILKLFLCCCWFLKLLKVCIFLYPLNINLFTVKPGLCSLSFGWLYVQWTTGVSNLRGKEQWIRLIQNSREPSRGIQVGSIIKVTLMKHSLFWSKFACISRKATGRWIKDDTLIHKHWADMT